MNWKLPNQTLDLSTPKLMGIVNLTPDSFSDGGKYASSEQAVEEALRMESEGASILDLGAESTRPQAAEVSGEEELARILPVLKELRSQTQCPISIDTTKPEVAEVCLDEGADIVNDVNGMMTEQGASMASVAAKFHAGVVLMHRRGTAATMMDFTDYEDVMQDVCVELRSGIDRALSAGVSQESIVVDPGIGFSKDCEQNLELLRRIDEMKVLGYPILLGASRKSFIGKVLNREVQDREFGTAASVAWGMMKGVSIFRVHRVDAMHDMIQMINAIQGEKQHVRT